MAQSVAVTRALLRPRKQPLPWPSPTNGWHRRRNRVPPAAGRSGELDPGGLSFRPAMGKEAGGGIKLEYFMKVIYERSARGLTGTSRTWTCQRSIILRLSDGQQASGRGGRPLARAAHSPPGRIVAAD